MELEKKFYRDEVHDMAVYTALAKIERMAELRRLLTELAATERKHAGIWKNVIEDSGQATGNRRLIGPTILYYIALRRLLGVAFTVKLLERGEERAIREYKMALDASGISGKGKAAIEDIIVKDETEHEKELAERMELYEGELNYIKSIIFGLNDGLVELLAVVAGLAVVASTAIVVAVAGIVVGLSGTLSMAAGEYLSSKSRGLVKTAMDEAEPHRTKPSKEAMYIGIFYFVGAIISVIPFLFGLNGISGIIVSIILVSVALSAVSTVVAVVSGTSARRRAAETLVISLGAAFITIMLGAVIRYYFGISI